MTSVTVSFIWLWLCTVTELMVQQILVLSANDITRMLNKTARIINGYIEYLGPKDRSLTNIQRHLYVVDVDANDIIV